MKVLLLHPPLTRKSFTSLNLIQEPLTLMALAPELREHEPCFVDLRLSHGLRRELAGFEPDVAIVPVTPLSIGALDSVLGELRRLAPKVRVLLVGSAEYGVDHVCERPREYMHAAADALVPYYYLGVLRKIVPQVLDAWQAGQSLEGVDGVVVAEGGGQWVPTAPHAHEPLDYGVPGRSSLGRWRGAYRFAGIGRMSFVLTSCGCRYKCRYCPMGKQGSAFWTRDLDDVTRELQSLEEPNVFLLDYEPLTEPEHMTALAERIEAAGIKKRFFLMTRASSVVANVELLERWKRIGLRWVYLGLDGHSDERLVEERKSSTVDLHRRALAELERLDLLATCGFLVRSDFEPEDFAELRRSVRELGVPMPVFAVEAPIMGSPLFDEREHELTTRDWSLFDLQHAVLPTKLPLGAFYHRMAGMHYFSGMRSLRAMLRHYPLRDFLRSWATGLLPLMRVYFAAREHAPIKDGTPQPRPAGS